jgi:hypothetical protein
MERTLSYESERRDFTAVFPLTRDRSATAASIVPPACIYPDAIPLIGGRRPRSICRRTVIQHATTIDLYPSTEGSQPNSGLSSTRLVRLSSTTGQTRKTGCERASLIDLAQEPV